MKYEREKDFLVGLLFLNILTVGITYFVVEYFDSSCIPFRGKILDLLFPFVLPIAIEAFVWIIYILIKKHKDLKMLWIGNVFGMLFLMIIAYFFIKVNDGSILSGPDLELMVMIVVIFPKLIVDLVATVFILTREKKEMKWINDKF